MQWGTDLCATGTDLCAMGTDPIAHSFKLDDFFGENLGEGSDVYFNLVLLYGPMFLGVGLIIAVLIITLVIGLKTQEQWAAAIAKKKKQ